MSIEELDGLVTWMRKRGVGTLVDGSTQIHLATLEEPSKVEPAPAKEETEEQRRERVLRERYGALPRKREGAE